MLNRFDSGRARRLAESLRSPSTNGGFALVVVLMIAALLLFAATLFMRTMRTERMAARNFADDTRARELARTALVRALEEIQNNCAGNTYFCSNPCPDIGYSTGSSADTSLLAGEAGNYVPRALRHDAQLVATNYCGYIDIPQSLGSSIKGSIAYLIVNCSGLIDANMAGGINRTTSISPTELPIETLAGDIEDMTLFTQDRGNDIRYETLPDLYRNNRGATNVAGNLFTYSYDPDRDVRFASTDSLGTETFALTDRFCINDTGASNYISLLQAAATLAGYSNTEATAIAWNIKNYIDADRIPDNATPAGYLDNSICEDIPLINEIVLMNLTNGSYQAVVELWYPFVPNSVSNNDFLIEVFVYANLATPTAVVSTAYSIQPMQFGGASEFASDYRCPFDLGSSGAVSSVNIVGVEVVVRDADGRILDQSPRLEFDDCGAWSVNDPRHNATSGAWAWSDLSGATLGRTNTICKPWANNGQGVPIYHRNGPMRNIGEIGYIYAGLPWQSVKLAPPHDNSASLSLPDLLTVRATNSSTMGLVNINSRQSSVIQTLFHGIQTGQGAATRPLTDSDALSLADGIISNSLCSPFTNNYDMLRWFAASSNYAGFSPDGVHTNGDAKEDVIRGILELITYRQNLFTIFLAGRLSSVNTGEPLAEKRAVAVVCRDAYTGKTFIRYFKWLAD